MGVPSSFFQGSDKEKHGKYHGSDNTIYHQEAEEDEGCYLGIAQWICQECQQQCRDDEIFIIFKPLIYQAM